LHRDGYLYIFAGSFEEIGGGLWWASGGGGDDALGAVYELGVGGAYVDHEVAVSGAGAHHDAGGEHVEDKLRGGAGFEAGAAGEDFRAGGGVDGDVYCLRDGRAGDAGEADGECAERFGVGESAENVGRAAGGGDADEGVGLGEAGLLEVAGTFFGGVFGVLAGEAEGAVAAGDESLEEVGRDGEGWGALAGVEDAEASAGAGTDVEEMAAAGEAGGDFVDGAGDGGELGADGGSDFRVFVVDELEHGEGGELVDVCGGGVAGFGGEGAEDLLVGCLHEKSMIATRWVES